jgi:hypothetical protein
MPEEMFLLIADISGYTQFMVKSEQEQTHGIYLINELMHSMVKEIALPMEISKLEGDAIFLYLPFSKLPKEMVQDSRVLTEKILRFFTAFKRKLNALQEGNVCDCGACSHLGDLNIKVVAHFGKASMVKIGSFMELSGVDVILVHRLLKNRAEGKRYLLLTEAAYQKLALPPSGKIVRGEEMDKDIGKIPTVVYYPQEGVPPPDIQELSCFEKMMGHLKLIIGAACVKWSKRPKDSYRNFPSVKS